MRQENAGGALARLHSRPARVVLAATLAFSGGWALLMPQEAQAQNVCAPDPATLFGVPPVATGLGGFACGEAAYAGGDSSTAVGSFTGEGSTDPGNARNTSFGASAGRNILGQDNTATGALAGSFVTGSRNTAMGVFAGRYLTGEQNVAIGYNAGGGNTSPIDGSPILLEVSRTVAIGADAHARFNDSTAIGQGAQTTRAGQVAVGTAASTYTLAGVTSAASTAAQTGDIFFVTTDNAGNLATANFNVPDIAGLDGRVGALEGSVGALSGRVDKAFEGTAMALAMAGGGLPSDKKYAMSINWGVFEGENAFAGTAAFRINEYMHVHGGVGVGARRGTVGGRAGLTVAW